MRLGKVKRHATPEIAGHSNPPGISNKQLMRIAQVSTLSSPVCENAGGSVEAWLWLLTRELTRLGHEVTVFAAAGSEIDGELVATLLGPYGAKDCLEDWQLC